MIQFAVALPSWVLALLVAAVAMVAWGSYAGALVPLSSRRRWTLIALRAATLLLIVACLLRPVRVMPPDALHESVVPILVDVSRSMRLADADGRPRIDAARDLIRRTLTPALAGRFRTEIWTFGDAVKPATADALSADASRSDLSGALRAIRDRYRERRVAGTVVISDGGDTSAEDAAASVDAATSPVYTIGVGMPRGGSDYEVLDVTAGEATLANASVDLTVSASRRGGGGPFDIRVLENGSPIDVRRVTPAGSGGPVHAVFTVSPARDRATLYTVEIPVAAGEIVVDNNRRSVIVEPPGRRRRILMIEGAPGFEHSFIKRALTADPAIELDSVVRKGRDTAGDATYFVQATAERAPLLAGGFPAEREALYRYDAIVLANVDPDSLSSAQFTAVADFVSQRGGGLLVFGARSFAQQGLVGTPVEEALPLNLSGRGGSVMLTSSSGGGRFAVSLTRDGEVHPVMRIGATAEETAKRWRAVPPLSGASMLGLPRPGAQVLALIRSPEGTRPLVAVQRYGQGRSMIFAGEASFRWRMQMPSNDNTFELFWRQTARWLTSGAPDPVAIVPPANVMPGDTALLTVDVRNDSFAAVSDARVAVRVTEPGGSTRDLTLPLADARAGRYSAALAFDQPGVYRVTTEARRGTTVIGTANRWILAGGADREMSDPRLNEEVLRRVSRASGGSYLSASDVPTLPSLLASLDAQPTAPRLQELWHNVWIFLAIVMLLATEWTLRRRWGLR